MKRKPDPEPYSCKCGCGRLIKPRRLTMRGCWSMPAFANKECRERGKAKRRNLLPPEPPNRAGTWAYWDKFLYGKQEAAA